MIKVQINPGILKRARELRGYSIDEISSNLQIDAGIYSQWEVTGDDIPFGKLKILSQKYKRQIAFFFLEKIPPKLPKPKDFRNLSMRQEPLSKEILLAFRRAIRYQKVMTELYAKEYFIEKYKWLTEYKERFGDSSNPDKIAYWLRNKLGYLIEDQIKDKNEYVTYNKWRNYFEIELGLFVFQFSMPTHEVQGFNYSDTYPFCIVINSRNYFPNSRIFTLFHEFSHVLISQSSLCIPDAVTEDQSEEYKINSFTGALLLPKDHVIYTTDPDEIYKFSKKYKVSSEVYLRRMKELMLITENQFFELLDIIKSRTKLKTGGGLSISQLQRSINERGSLFCDIVISAAKNGIVSYDKAADILGIKVNHFISY